MLNLYHSMRAKTKVVLAAASLFLSFCVKTDNEIRVTPADDIQKIVDEAATRTPKPKIIFTEGKYVPRRRGQALLHLNARHDGIEIRGEGKVVLDASNPALADPKEFSYPAAVNHVLYLGHGLTEKTKISGLTLTGAKGLFTRENQFEAEPDRSLERRVIFYADGGGIKVFGNSSPVLENLAIEGNRTAFCGGGISIEQMGLTNHPVRMKNIVFRKNEVALTGAAIDLLPGSHAVVEDSRFEENHANVPWITMKEVLSLREKQGFPRVGRIDWRKFENSSAITVFYGSSIEIRNSVLTRNSGGMDYNSYFRWYWRSPFSPIKELPSRIENVSFGENRLHATKGFPWENSTKPL